MMIERHRLLRTATAIVAASVLALTATSATAAKKAPKTKKPPATKATTATTAATTATSSATTATSTATTKAAGKAGALGKQADGTYAGKGGFKIDLASCPKDYDVNQGISATEVKLFSSTTKSGPLAGFGLVSDGMNTYFNYVNSQGGVAGHKIAMDLKDDVYTADKTKANVTEAIAGRKYAALVTTLGSPNNLAIWDDTTKECMPQLLNGSGLANWGDVDGHPWTTGMQIDYTTEAILWAEWAKQQFPGGAKVAMLTYNNDFGKAYSKGFRAAIKGTNITVVKEELHEATAPNLTNQMTNLDATLPDLYLIQTTAVFCTQALAEIEKRQIKAKVMMSATCASLSQFFQPLIDQGLTGAGTYIVQTFKDPNDPDFKDDPFIKQFQSVTKAAGQDEKQTTYFTGWIFAWFMVEILKEAATYEGGINRANIMLAARGIDKNFPGALDGIQTKMNGLQDAYLIEGGRIAQYKVRDPKVLGTFFGGDVIDKNGALGTFKKFNTSAF